MTEEKDLGTNGLQSNPDLNEVHDSMLEGLSQLADYFGFSKIMGQLYGILLLNPKPLSLDDMVEQLGISKASVSINMRTLEHFGMVRQVWLKGGGSDRRKYYEAVTDFWQIITNLLSGREMRDVDRAISVMDKNSEHLRNTMPDMEESEREIAELYIERMEQLQALFRFAQMLMSTILNQINDSTEVSDISHIEIE
jgi:DNA-binding transcriptional regulator GbsR (MarR family)